MKLYEVTAKANLDYKGCHYRDVRLVIFRVSMGEWNTEQAQLHTDSYTQDFVQRHLFTIGDAADIRRNLERLDKCKEVNVNEVPLPLEGCHASIGTLGFEPGEDLWLLAEDPEWDGPEVQAFFSVRKMDPMSSLEILEPRVEKIEASLQQIQKLLQKSA